MTDDDREMKEVDRRELRTTATPQQVWDAWAKPEIIAGWFADRAHGTPEKGSTITHVFEDFGVELPFTVVEATPAETIVFDGVGPGGRPFRQEIRVRRDGGETVMELVHSGFDTDASFDDEFEGMDSGWILAFGILRHYLENHFGRDKTSWLVMQPAPFDFARADALFRSADGLGQWLTDGASAIGDAGQSVKLALQGERVLDGEVLAWSGREVALSWPEIEGVLELKAFSAGPGKTMIGLRVLSWADAGPDGEAMRAWMTERVGALARRLSS